MLVLSVIGMLGVTYLSCPAIGGLWFPHLPTVCNSGFSRAYFFGIEGIMLMFSLVLGWEK